MRLFAFVIVLLCSCSLPEQNKPEVSGKNETDADINNRFKKVNIHVEEDKTILDGSIKIVREKKTFNTSLEGVVLWLHNMKNAPVEITFKINFFEMNGVKLKSQYDEPRKLVIMAGQNSIIYNRCLLPLSANYELEIINFSELRDSVRSDNKVVDK